MAQAFDLLSTHPQLMNHSCHTSSNLSGTTRPHILIAIYYEVGEVWEIQNHNGMGQTKSVRGVGCMSMPSRVMQTDLLNFETKSADS